MRKGFGIVQALASLMGLGGLFTKPGARTANPIPTPRPPIELPGGSAYGRIKRRGKTAKQRRARAKAQASKAGRQRQYRLAKGMHV